MVYVGGSTDPVSLSYDLALARQPAVPYSTTTETLLFIRAESHMLG